MSKSVEIVKHEFMARTYHVHLHVILTTGAVMYMVRVCRSLREATAVRNRFLSTA